MENFLYNKLNTYLKSKFGERTLKIPVDGGFTCPNRDGYKGSGGCVFCSSTGSGDHLHHGLSIKEQISQHLASYRGKRANKFIVYFQNFSNTYGPITALKEKYYAAINADSRIVAISIGTRPDCINEDICKLLSNISKTHKVFVELGLQTINKKNMKNLNLCYTKKDFIKAVNLLHKYNIETIAHIMIGLPNESIKDTLKIVKFLNKLPIKGIKLHSTYVEENTKLASLYKIGKYTPLTLNEYIKIASVAIAHLRSDIIIHRISGDANRTTLLAPNWNAHKKPILNGIENYLRLNNLYQGKLSKIK